MIKVLEQAIDKVRHLPEDGQVHAAEILEIVAVQHTDDELTPAQIEGVKQAQQQVAHGRYASDVAVTSFFARFRSA